MVLFWVVLVVALLLFELHHLAFYSLFFAIGAFAAGLVAVVAPDAIGLQALVAVAVSIAGVILVRPYVSNAFHRHKGGHVARGVHGGLVGQEAVTLDEVGDVHQIGHVRLAGERWLAVTSGPTIEAGRSVFVTAVRGTTLDVWPIDLRSIEAPDGADRSET
ncbi:MAG: NfeD-like C-terminal, partner-binding [Acidimicrobiaceae bacterium]|jgi:membrane protein implicated in regulation of membrane protease activity